MMMTFLNQNQSDGDEEVEEIKEITALKHFTSIVQKALAATASVPVEREREKGRKRPKHMLGTHLGQDSNVNKEAVISQIKICQPIGMIYIWMHI